MKRHRGSMCLNGIIGSKSARRRWRKRGIMMSDKELTHSFPPTNRANAHSFPLSLASPSLLAHTRPKKETRPPPPSLLCRIPSQALPLPPFTHLSLPHPSPSILLPSRLSPSSSASPPYPVSFAIS